MTNTGMDEHRDDEGGLPVGRMAAERARASSSRQTPKRRSVFAAALPLIILALVVGLGVGLAIGFLVGGDSDGAAATTTTSGVTTSTEGSSTTLDPTAFGAVTVTGDSLPVLQQGAVDTAIGLPVPEVSGADYAGNSFSIEANGVPKIVVGLAHWCPYCNEELPVLRDWYDAGGVPEGVELLLLSVFVDPSRANYPPGPWLADNGWMGPVIADDAVGSLAGALGIASVPYNLLVAPDGTVAGRVTGGLTVEQLDQAVEYLVGLSTTTTTAPG